MYVMLFSNGKVAGNEQFLEYGFAWIESMVEKSGAKKLLFIPYAMIRGSYDQRLEQLQETFRQFGCTVSGIHHQPDPVLAIQEADGFIVSGGNTWVLNQKLHELGLIHQLQQVIIQECKLYIGWSAGTNIASPTIRTTNDMPIASEAVLPALNLIPFQINPHYIEGNISGHLGETRDERIEEFLIVNPEMIVLGLPEGTMLQIDGEHLSYHQATGTKLKLFCNQKPPRMLDEQEDCQFLLRK